MLTEHTWIDFAKLTFYQECKPSIMLDDQGNEWSRFQLDKRDPIDLVNVPKHVIQAFLAAEDHQFYEHVGISWRGIIRSILINLYRRKKSQGASTITQQLVKLLFLDTKKTFTRKLKEQFLACILELQCTKDQILELYLNHICFGCGIYGIEAAAQRFWNKHVDQLSINEAATLAGIIRSPSKYCPLNHPCATEQRRNIVLACMLNMQYIDQVTYTNLLQQPLHLSTTIQAASHMRELVRIRLEQLVGKHTLYTSGLTIKTTIHATMQEHAVKTFTQHMRAVRKSHVKDADGALLCIEVATGAIKALIGGYDYQASQFNRAIQARRQMGSVFKPLIYAAALERGAEFSDIKIDQPISCIVNNVAWEPHNVHRTFEGPMTLASALMHSNNSIPIQLVLEHGLKRVIEYAKTCELSGPLYPYPSLALGCVDSTPYEVVGMFNIFANKGVYVQPYIIQWIKDQQGNKIWKHTPVSRPVLDWMINSKVAQVMINGIDYWKKIIRTPWPPCEIIGKTGTTNDARTCWFVGSTPTYTTALYIGCDDNKPMGNNVYGITTSLPLWAAFNKAIEQPQAKFTHDPRLIPILIDEKTGKPITDSRNAEAITLLVDSTSKQHKTVADPS